MSSIDYYTNKKGDYFALGEHEGIGVEIDSSRQVYSIYRLGINMIMGVEKFETRIYHKSRMIEALEIQAKQADTILVPLAPMTFAAKYKEALSNLSHFKTDKEHESKYL